MLRFLFPLCLFLSAVLLFSIQPMVAKSLLPVYGGTPAVWTVCMLFFQVVLLVSYAYAWLLSSFHKPAIWRFVHTVLIVFSLFALPLKFHPLIMDGLPEWIILYNLITQIGLPLLLIGASAPLLQFAYSQTKEKRASDPYFLYVASNLGSLISLLSYPWVIEQFIGLTLQFHLWSIGYVVYLLLLLVVLYVTPFQPQQQAIKTTKTLPWRDMALWVFLSFIPCSLMLGVTLYITTDIAATPLFWVVPLALYLLTFVITFSTKPIISHRWVIQNSLFFLIFTVVGFILGINNVKIWQLILVNLMSFFVLALLCHGELFRKRPKPQGLTLFYFCLALGGVLAGVFNGIVAPHFFNQIYEYPLVILFSVLIIPNRYIGRRWWLALVVCVLLLPVHFIPDDYRFLQLSPFHIGTLLALTIIVLWQQSKISLFLSLFVLFGFIFLPIFQKGNTLLQKRSFYAVNRVENRDGMHAFISQSTLHGMQFMGEKKKPSGFGSYYGAVEPVVKELQNQSNSLSVTLMGLGAGTMVCQFRDTDHIYAIEIDQQVIDIAKNPRLFTYLSQCPASVDIIKNDGRLAIDKLANASQQLVILDAFNSDAIPMHLMTLEAFTMYQKKISNDGVILVNISNRHLQLLPVLNAMGHSLDLMVFYVHHKGDPKLGQFDSEWALLTENQALATRLMQGSGWRFLTDDKQFLWTDDYSNIIPLLKW